MLLKFAAIKDEAQVQAAFWQWVDILADSPEQAVSALYWAGPAPDPAGWSRELAEFFFGADQPLKFFRPGAELKAGLADLTETEFHYLHTHDPNIRGWAMLTLPLRDGQEDGDIWGLPISFFIREVEGGFVFEFEQLHD